jgi:hypothetical protein
LRFSAGAQESLITSEDDSKMAQQTNKSGGGDAQLAPPPVQESKTTTKEKDRRKILWGKRENFWDFLLVAFKLLARLIFQQHKERTCFMLCANLMPPLRILLRVRSHVFGEEGEENKRGNLNKYE